MANSADGPATFFHALSDMWTRFFQESDQLKAMYRGQEINVGQVYLELMGTILSMSLREVPVFRREFFKLLTIREDNIYTRTSDGRYAFEVTDIGLQSCQFFYNKILDPTSILENPIDFEIDTSGDVDEIVFVNNPFNWDGAGNVVSGFAYRTVQVEDDDGNVTDEREIAFWIPDAQLDGNDLYLNFGYLLSRFEPSSESYRSLLIGMTQYFVLGPTRQTLTSALNAILGLPLIRDDGEILQSVDESDTAVNTVTTDRASYELPKDVPIREDILDTDNWGVLTFQSLENISAFITVEDTISDPTWWYGKYVPQEMLPDEPKARRRISPTLVELKCNVPAGQIYCGDPGLICGADFDGDVPAGRVPYRHLFAYVVFERWLKHHAFSVEFDVEAVLAGAVPFSRLDLDLNNVVVAGKSAYTYLYVEPGLEFEDLPKILDQGVTIEVGSLLEETVTGESSAAMCGTTIVSGTYYKYTASGIEIKNIVDDPHPGSFPDSAGYTEVVCGGSDPSTLQSDDGSADHMDWPVQITVT